MDGNALYNLNEEDGSITKATLASIATMADQIALTNREEPCLTPLGSEVDRWKRFYDQERKSCSIWIAGRMSVEEEFSTGQEVWSVFERPENEAIVPVFDPQPLEAAAPCQNASGNPSAYSKVKLGSLDILSSVEPAPASPTTQGQFQEQRGRRAKRDNMDTATAAANEIGLDLMADANSLDPGLQLQIRRDEVACSNEQRAGLQGVGYCNKSLLQLPGGACMKPGCKLQHTPWPTSGEFVITPCMSVCELCSRFAKGGANSLRAHVTTWHIGKYFVPNEDSKHRKLWTAVKSTMQGRRTAVQNPLPGNRGWPDLHLDKRGHMTKNHPLRCDKYKNAYDWQGEAIERLKRTIQEKASGPPTQDSGMGSFLSTWE